MIKIIDNDFKLHTEFCDFCKTSSFGTRIYSHYLCYGYDLNFVDFWVQTNSDSITCAICKIDGDFILCLSDDADFPEITAFLDFQEKLSVTFDEKYRNALVLQSKSVSVGDILLYNGNDKFISDYDTVTPEIKEYYELLLTCESEDFFVPGYMNFLSDVSRRQQRDMCSICGIKVDETLVSCAMTVSHTYFSVILGAVATHPLHRKHGYAGCIVRKLAETYAVNKSVYIYTTVERNTRFYESLGFYVCDIWIKLSFGG